MVAFRRKIWGPFTAIRAFKMISPASIPFLTVQIPFSVYVGARIPTKRAIDSIVGHLIQSIR